MYVVIARFEAKKNRFIHPFIALHEMEKKSQFLESTLTNLR